jgi:hypothetical protein
MEQHVIKLIHSILRDKTDKKIKAKRKEAERFNLKTIILLHRNTHTQKREYNQYNREIHQYNRETTG